MQCVNLNKCSTNIIESKVSQDTAKCDIVNHEVILQQQMAKLNEVIVNLEDVIRIKDSQLEHTHREKSRLLTELKKQQRCNRNLKQQLDDEKLFYQREKDHFNEEMRRYRIRYTGNNTSKFQQKQYTELEQARTILEEKNKQLKEMLENKSEIIYNLCIKFLRMKHAKDTLRYKLDQLLREHLLIMAEMMEKLDEARKELNLIVSEKFQGSLPLSKAKFVQVVQRNSRLIYENATLKVQIHQLTQNIEQLKNQTQQTKKINIDARIIEKLTMQNSTRSALDKSDKNVLLAKLSQPVEHFKDENTSSSSAHSRNVDNYMIDEIQNITNNNSKEVHAEPAQSRLGIIEAPTQNRQILSSIN